MQRLEVSGAVRPIYGSLGVKRLNSICCDVVRSIVSACQFTKSTLSLLLVLQSVTGKSNFES